MIVVNNLSGTGSGGDSDLLRVIFASASGSNVIQDETGTDVNDETGGQILDET